MTVRSVWADIPWWPRGTRFASLPPPPPSPLGRKRCPRRLSAVEMCPGRSSGHWQAVLGIPSTDGSVACGGPSLGCGYGAPQVSARWVGPIHGGATDPRVGGCNMCSSSAACSSLQVGSLLMASSASLAAGSEARWAAVRCALASAVSDGQCCGWLSRRALTASLPSGIVRVP
jgi:hypothetical protein